MSAIIRLQSASLAFGTAAVLDGIDFTVYERERVCIVGRNGAGKSSLLKVLNNDIQLDDGTIQRIGTVHVAMLPQDPPADSGLTVFEYVSQGFPKIGALLAEHHKISASLATDISETNTEQALTRLSSVQQQIETLNGWQLNAQIEQVLSRLQLDPDAQIEDLSGGWLRRAALARALAQKPDLLLLDEPTNHLDVSSVEWLESLVRDFGGAVVFISHDRAFIRSIATRIVDLDRGNLTSFPGNYQHYLDEKQRLLEVEDAQNAEFDKKLAQEEAWIRQGIKARRTRNEGRVRELHKLREQRAQRRTQQGRVKLEQQSGDRSGKLVIEGAELEVGYQGTTLFSIPELLIRRGDKVALVGPNGCGKSTLVKLIIGQLEPLKGEVKRGTNLQVAYFDQHRSQLDPEKSIADNVGEGKADVTHNGRTRHIYSYLQDFLFTPQQARMPVKALSGGEKNRVMLAKILLKPGNLLVLDEPTNDLDIDTLELLEELVCAYPGTVLLVSHDREFIDNTATSALLFEDGSVTEIAGGYQDIERYRNARTKITERQAGKKYPDKGTSGSNKGSESKQVLSTPADSKKSAGTGNQKKKLSYKDQRELEQIPARIEALEVEIERLQQQINDPDFFQKPVEQTSEVTERFSEAETELMEVLERWDYLEQLQEK